MFHMLHFNRALDYNDDTIDPDCLQDYGGGIIPESLFVQESGIGQEMAAGGNGHSMSIHHMLDAHGISLGTPPLHPPPLHPPPLHPPHQQRQSIMSLYPHISRQFNEDFDSCVRIDWEKCSAKQIYDICTSTHLQCGASKSMAWMLQHAVKQLTGNLSCFCQKVL